MKKPDKIDFAKSAKTEDVVEMPIARRMAGWAEEVIPYQWLNWLFKSLSEWDEYLESRLDGVTDTDQSISIGFTDQTTHKFYSLPIPENYKKICNVFVKDNFVTIELAIKGVFFRGDDGSWPQNSAIPPPDRWNEDGIYKSEIAFAEIKFNNFKYPIADGCIPKISCYKCVSSRTVSSSIRGPYFKFINNSIIPYYLDDNKNIQLGGEEMNFSASSHKQPNNMIEISLHIQYRTTDIT